FGDHEGGAVGLADHAALALAGDGLDLVAAHGVALPVGLVPGDRDAAVGVRDGLGLADRVGDLGRGGDRRRGGRVAGAVLVVRGHGERVGLAVGESVDLEDSLPRGDLPGVPGAFDDVLGERRAVVRGGVPREVDEAVADGAGQVGDRAGRADLLAAAAFVAALVLVAGLVVVLRRGVAAEDVGAVLLGEAGVAVGGDDHGVVGVHGVGEQGLAGVVELDRAAAGFELDLVEFGAFQVVDPDGARRAVGDVDALVEFDGGAEQLGGAGGDVEAPGVVVVDGDDRGRVRDGHGRDGAGAGVGG